MTKKQLTDQDIIHLAKLANLSITKAEIAEIKPQLIETLNVVDNLNEIDTESVHPSSQVTGLTNIYRDDQIDSSRILKQEEALINSPNTHQGYFVVPQLIDHEA